ncbi:MAG: V-type ATP synthase subunit F [Oscillospiraceae bacterium]|nr:V-type ATP synthase subunit F [Oscillospiraceae bacterium]
MKFYLISDNIDTQMGMRLAGVEGEVAHTSEEVNAALDRAFSDEDTAVVLMTEKLVTLCRERVYDLKLNSRRPLIVEIPDRHGNSGVSEAISRYVSEAIGIKL